MGNPVQKIPLSDDKFKWTANFCEIDEARLRNEADFELMQERKQVADRLAAPHSYVGEDQDQAEEIAIDSELARRQEQRAYEARVNELLADSKRELGELSADTGSLDQGFNGKMIGEYQELRAELNEQVEAAEASLKTSDRIPEIVFRSWADVLYRVGDLRKVLISNLNVDTNRDLTNALARLQGLSADLKKLQASAKRIEEAVEQIEDGEKWVSRMLKLNDAIEMLLAANEAAEAAGKAVLNTVEVGEDVIVAGINTGKDVIVAGAKWGKGRVAAYAKLAKEGYSIATTSTVIEQGIKNLVEYNIELAVAAEGFTSTEELDRAIEAKTEAIKTIGSEISKLAQKKQKLEQQSASAVKGSKPE
jgi:prefoldin subunit 5